MCVFLQELTKWMVNQQSTTMSHLAACVFKVSHPNTQSYETFSAQGFLFLMLKPSEILCHPSFLEGEQRWNKLVPGIVAGQGSHRTAFFTANTMPVWICLGNLPYCRTHPNFFVQFFWAETPDKSQYYHGSPWKITPPPLLLHLPVREVANISQPKTHVWENHPIVTYLITVTGRLHKSQAGCFTPTSRQWGNPCPPLRVHWLGGNLLPLKIPGERSIIFGCHVTWFWYIWYDLMAFAHYFLNKKLWFDGICPIIKKIWTTVDLPSLGTPKFIEHLPEISSRRGCPGKSAKKQSIDSANPGHDATKSQPKPPRSIFLFFSNEKIPMKSSNDPIMISFMIIPYS